MSENEIVEVLLFFSKSLTKDMNFRIITSSIRFIKDTKRLESLSSWEKPFWHIFTGIKVWNVFSLSVSVFYVTYLLWRVRFSFFVCIVLHISLFFKFSVVCRWVCYNDE